MPADRTNDGVDRLAPTPAPEGGRPRLVDLEQERFARNLAKLEEARRRALRRMKGGGDAHESPVLPDRRIASGKGGRARPA